MRKPRVLLIAGYFDWFSGYQETALAAAFAKIADVEIVASTRVSPAFNADHLGKLGLSRDYEAGSLQEHGVTVTRFRCYEKRSMTWSFAAVRYISKGDFDLIVQVMPGQVLSAAPAFTRMPGRRVVLYGDNQAMWAELGGVTRLLKWTAFSITKGLLYRRVNRRSDETFGYTQDTVNRLRIFGGGRAMHLMPLAFSPERFFHSETLRTKTRKELGLKDSIRVVIFAGKFEERKRLDWLLAAYELIADSNEELYLILVGSGTSDYSKSFTDKVDDSRHRDRIILSPFVDPKRLNALFNAADLGVWPRNPAITIQQSMGTGLAVVLPRNNFVGHLLRPETGRYYSTLAPEAGGLQETIDEALATVPLTAKARRRRANINVWLSADRIVSSLLPETNGQVSQAADKESFQPR